MWGDCAFVSNALNEEMFSPAKVQKGECNGTALTPELVMKCATVRLETAQVLRSAVASAAGWTPSPPATVQTQGWQALAGSASATCKGVSHSAQNDAPQQRYRWPEEAAGTRESWDDAVPDLVDDGAMTFPEEGPAVGEALCTSLNRSHAALEHVPSPC